LPPRGVLWDVGNVIVRWNPRTLYRKIFDEDRDLDFFLNEVCPLSWHANTDLGVTFGENIAARVAIYPQFRVQIEAWFGRWDEMFSGTIPGTVATMFELARNNVPQFGLTNMSSETWPGVQAMSDCFSVLQDVVVSAEEGLIKPDAKLFAIACRRAGLAPQDLLFIDDSATNIEAARALGFHVHRFEEGDDLEGLMKSHSLL
jgi:FMN phosphatase YigB (HAD superfamily)